MADNRPSKKQRELLQFIGGFIKGYGYGPSYREIMRALGYKSVSTVAVHVDGLITRGYLRKRDNSARSIEIVTQPTITKSSNTVHIKWLKSELKKRIADGMSDEDQGILQKAINLLENDTTDDKSISSV